MDQTLVHQLQKMFFKMLKYFHVVCVVWVTLGEVIKFRTKKVFMEFLLFSNVKNRSDLTLNTM